MARARKSHKRDEEKTKTTRNGLEPAYGQAGQNKYVIYCNWKRDDLSAPKVLVLNFRAKYAARFMLSQLLDGDNWEWTDPIGSRKAIITSEGYTVAMYGDDLKMLLNYEPTGLEADWEDEQVARQCQKFRYGRPSDEPRRPRAEDNVFDGEEVGDSSDVDSPRKGKKVKKDKKESRPKIDRTGKISANDIASELGVEGREVRQVLRAMKLEKPAGGWLFDEKTAKEIKDQVKKGLKEAKEKKKKK